MSTKRAYLHTLGLTKSPTGKGRFSREAIAVLDKERKAGRKFDDDEIVVKPAKAKSDKVIAMPKADKVNPNSYDPKAVRKWASENGHTVGERGRIHSDIVNAYFADKAGSGETIEKRENEFNVFADLARETYPRDAILTGNYVYNGKTYTMKVSTKTACYNCRTSIVICRCGNPTIVSAHGSCTLPVTMIGR